MGNKQSGYLERQQAQKNALMHQTELLVKQYMLDTLLISLNRHRGFGYDRLMEILDEWEKTRDEYRPALDPKDPECDVAQEHMDRALDRIINGKMELIPFAERYQDLRPVKYGKKKGGRS